MSAPKRLVWLLYCLGTRVWWKLGWRWGQELYSKADELLWPGEGAE